MPGSSDVGEIFFSHGNHGTQEQFIDTTREPVNLGTREPNPLRSESTSTLQNLSINIRQHIIHRTKNTKQICYSISTRDIRQHLHMRERWRSYSHPVR
jgi:hypothetical protein